MKPSGYHRATAEFLQGQLKTDAVDKIGYGSNNLRQPFKFNFRCVLARLEVPKSIFAFTWILTILPFSYQDFQTRDFQTS